jgi:hypothetical protein
MVKTGPCMGVVGRQEAADGRLVDCHGSAQNCDRRLLRDETSYGEYNPGRQSSREGSESESLKGVVLGLARSMAGYHLKIVVARRT